MGEAMTEPRPDGKSNCLIFAFQHWFKFGGYVCIRKSNYGWWPHFLWTQDLKVFEEFHPVRKKQKGWLPPFIFCGYVRVSGANNQSKVD
jgi:hypothetical protein